MKNILNKLIFAAFSLASGIAMAAPCGGPQQPACAVPEPSTLPLVALALVGAVAVGTLVKRRRK